MSPFRAMTSELPEALLQMSSPFYNTKAAPVFHVLEIIQFWFLWFYTQVLALLLLVIVSQKTAWATVSGLMDKQSSYNRFRTGPCTAARWEMGPVCQYSMKNTDEMGFFKLGMMPVKAVELLWFVEEQHLNCNILLLYFSG